MRRHSKGRTLSIEDGIPYLGVGKKKDVVSCVYGVSYRDTQKRKESRQILLQWNIKNTHSSPPEHYNHSSQVIEKNSKKTIMENVRHALRAAEPLSHTHTHTYTELRRCEN